MVGFEKLLIIAGCAATLSAPAQSFPHSPVERAQTFSLCAGRYSALAEHGYLLGGAAIAEAEARRDAAASLLEAVLPDAMRAGLPAEQSMAWRIEAKMAQKTLLARAMFHLDPLVIEVSRRAAEENVAACDSLILGT